MEEYAPKNEKNEKNVKMTRILEIQSCTTSHSLLLPATHSMSKQKSQANKKKERHMKL
jgi:hypothetical protein